MVSRNYTRWVLWVLGGQVFLAAVVGAAPGSGVQHRLDAREGVESQVFQGSLHQAMKGMTPTQIEAYNWAVNELDTKTFVARYGSTPTVREVIIGQVARVVDEGRKRTAFLDEQFQKMPGRVEASLRSYQQALDLLGTYQPVVTRIEYGDRRWSGSSDLALVSYKLMNPKRLQLETLPCRLMWKVGSASGRQSYDFDCLTQKRMANGEYFLAVPVFRGKKLPTVEVVLDMCRMQSPDKCPSMPWDSIGLVQDLLPELLEFWRIRIEMGRALGYKSVV